MIVSPVSAVADARTRVVSARAVGRRDWVLGTRLVAGVARAGTAMANG